VLATILQVGWLAAEVVIVSAVAYFAAAAIWPLLFDRVSPLTVAIGLPLVGSLAVFLYIPLSLATVVLLKRLLIGKYQAGRWPVWGTYYVRHWAVCQVLRTVPWRFLEGTDFQLMALRALGARIGQRVHIHRGVDLLQGGWDLLTIGDDVMIGQEATIRVVDLDDEELIAEPVVIESAATVETRASVAGGATIRAGGYLTALSSLSEGATIPEGEQWDGVPAARIGLAPATPTIDLPAPEFSPAAMGTLMLVSRLLSFMVVPTLSVWLAITLGATADASFLFAEGAWAVSLGLSVLIVPVVVTLQAVGMRLLGPIKPGVMSRWSRDYVRVWIKTDLLRRAGDWLAGTLMWPIWLRAAGMKIGRDCEISTIIDVVPELVTIGPTTFFADGVYIGGPILHRGTVTLAHTHVGSEVFLGNHVVIPAGSHVADRVLIGVSTVAGPSAERAGSAWFGHPPFALARPQAPALDRRLTHHPSLIRYINRWFWEIGRFAIPAASAAVLLPTARLGLSAAASPDATVAWTAFVLMPSLVVISAAAWCAFVLAFKWLLLGRVRPGQHALWSCWCSRWDFHYMVWDRLARPFLARFDGTLLLAWYLRAMGMKIGKRVVLGPGFSQVVDPDMIEIEDDATVHALFQAHTFEDRVLKIDKVRIGRRATVSCGTVLFYGADVGDGASVAAQSVVMKHERLLPHQKYEGCPSGRRLEQTNDASVFVQVDLLG
jgi:non-ribosomal peptide synthetase-like protein